MLPKDKQITDKAKAVVRFFGCLIRPWGVLASLMLCLQPSALSFAQQGNPEIYVDMSVLQELGGNPQGLKPVILRPPASVTQASPAPARLTTPATSPAQPLIPDSRPPLVPPYPAASPIPVKVSAPPALPADQVRPPVPSISSAALAPQPVSPPTATEKREPAIQQGRPPSPPAAIAFPINTKIRQETSDPSVPANISRPVPLRSGIAGNLKDVVPSRPAPDFDPSATPTPSGQVRDLTESPGEASDNIANLQKAPVVPGHKPGMQTSSAAKTVASSNRPSETGGIATAYPLKTPPVPPRRPDVEKVSPEIIAALIERENKKMAAERPSIDLTDPPPPPGPRGKKNMPAVAKPDVQAEPLEEQLVKLSDASDPLLGNLVEKDKESLVATIESLVAEREDGQPLPGTEDKKLVREQGSNIIAAEPMQRPYNVYRPKHDKPAEVALIEQRMEAESEDKSNSGRISLPFDEDATDLDTGSASMIEDRIVPLLNDNPSWKLQIQAYASPDKDGSGGARKESLARGLAVRTYLMGKGIEASRLEVRALGTESDHEPRDRVDLIVIDPTQKG